MTFVNDPVLITGGAGFIGSHLVDKLASDGTDITIVDNLSTGKKSNLILSTKYKNIKFVELDLSKINTIKENFKNFKTIFHVAAYPEVRTGFENPQLAYQENVENTYRLLEEIRKSNVEKFIFTSSSVVYGEPMEIPTPENYGPLIPISAYGGSKLACEGLISAYCHTYGIKGVILRFANVIGSRSRHGVIWDFINKLLKNKNKLEVLGNGKQNKSYIHIDDCIDGILFSTSHAKQQVEIFNLGNNDAIDVINIAKIVCKAMNSDESDIILSGGTHDGRGWIGDVTKMNLDISKLKKHGWNPKFSSEQAVQKTCEELIKEISDG